MDYKKLLQEFLDSARVLTVVGDQRQKLIGIVRAAGIIVTEEFTVQSLMVAENHIKKIFTSLDALPVLKISAKRIFRQHGINI